MDHRINAYINLYTVLWTMPCGAGHVEIQHPNGEHIESTTVLNIQCRSLVHSVISCLKEVFSLVDCVEQTVHVQYKLFQNLFR